MALPELDVAGVQRWCAARVPEHARHQVRVEYEVAHHTSRSSSGVPPGARTSGPNGPPFRSHACVTPPPTSPGPCTGATATFASTSTSPWLPHTRVEDLLTELDRDPASLGPTYQLRHQTAHSPPLRWGQLQPSRRGQFRLTSPILQDVVEECLCPIRRQVGEDDDDRLVDRFAVHWLSIEEDLLVAAYEIDRV
jgi:hypothetical protein